MTTTTAIFNRAATNDYTQLAQIVAAYKAAGLTPPTPALGIRDRITAAPTTDQVSARLADEALTTTDPEQWYTDALEQLRTAQAADALKAAFGRNYHAAVHRALPELLGQATADLTPSFDKVVRTLTTAAKQLPAGVAALDPETNIAADTGGALNKARHSIEQLTPYASIYQLNPVQNVPPALVKLLPILDLPHAEVEQIAKTAGIDISTLNTDQLDGTLTIRRLTEEAKDHGADQCARQVCETVLCCFGLRGQGFLVAGLVGG
ncbi:hypothetical protein IWX75_002910 [Arthrobacter sp. CAN_A6]|uniref:hypothetical protein n=1 Tax=Arthrobacter sp. CAN_A6 TaxID=2787721 RepID=UPI0018CA7265